MRKQINKTQNWLAFVVLLVVVSGCKFWTETSGGDTNGKKEDNVAQNKKSDSNKTSDKDDKSSKSGLAKNIVGTWNGGDPKSDEKLVLTFKENGSVIIANKDGEAEDTVNAEYSVIDEKTIEIKFDDGKSRKITDIKINGDTMKANGKDGVPGLFKRANGKTDGDSENSSDDDDV